MNSKVHNNKHILMNCFKDNSCCSDNKPCFHTAGEKHAISNRNSRDNLFNTKEKLLGDAQSEWLETQKLLTFSYLNHQEYFQLFVENIEEFILLSHNCLNKKSCSRMEQASLFRWTEIVLRKSRHNIFIIKNSIFILSSCLQSSYPLLPKRIKKCSEEIETLINAWQYFFDIIPNFEDQTISFLCLLKKAETEIKKAHHQSIIILEQNKYANA